MTTKLTLGSKNDMRNLVSFNESSGKSENLHFDVDTSVHRLSKQEVLSLLNNTRVFQNNTAGFQCIDI